MQAIIDNPVAGMLTKIAEGISLAYSAIFKGSMPDYCTLETADSEHSLVTAEGRLLSGFRLDGLVSAIGSDEFENLVSKLVSAFRPFLRDTSHTVQIFAGRDHDGIEKALKTANRGSRATIRSLKMQLNDVLDSREKNMARKCSTESLYMALWTHPTAIPAPELKSANATRKDAAKKMPPGSMKGGAQDMFGTISALRDKHLSYVKTIQSSMARDKAGFLMEILSAHQMLRVARMEMDPGFTPDTWKPALPGDPVPGVFRGEDAPRTLTLADAQYPPIDWQLFPRDAERVGTKYVKLGDRIYAPIYIEIPPQVIEPFSNLFDKLQTIDVPWRISFTLDGGGMKYTSLKAGIAAFMAWASPYNRRINDSIKAMKDHATDGATYVRLKLALCTWAPVDDEPLLRSRVSQLAHAVSSWGDCEVREETGNPIGGLFSTVPFLSQNSIANPSVAPLSHVMRMLPIMRQSSPWVEGSVLYRTRDGKLIPFEPGSDQQDTWNYILFAPPGSGKSVQMANLLLAAVLQPGIRQLPRIGIIDIGPSSKGLIGLIKDALPASERHKVAYFRLKNTEEFAINPFDTFPGCRFPTPQHKAFLVNLLTQMATPAERMDAYSSISEVASQVIDDIYTQKSDSSRTHPNQYGLNVEPAVDKLLTTYGFNFNRNTSWWSVVDFLFEKGHTHEATLAQRHAVPNMQDIPAVVQTSSIQDQFGKALVETQETLANVFGRLITSAIRMYPILSNKTVFDLGEIRIAALDLDEVAKSGSVADERQTALMYLLARFVLTKEYKLDKKYAESDRVLPLYRQYMLQKAVEVKENKKWICYDEFHRTAKSPAVQDEVLVDMREGRKWNLGVILASQSLDDFPDTFKEFATGIFILKAANHQVADKLQKLFGFNDTTKAMMLKYCNGPVPGEGAPMMLHLLLKSGVTDMLLYSTLGPEELWALSTTAEDAALRDRVSQILQEDDPENGSTRARSALAEMFPGGAAKKVTEVKRAMGDAAESEEAEAGAIETIAKQVLAKIAADARRTTRTKEHALN